MKRARDDIEPGDLLLDQPDQARVRMPVADRGVGAHHVKVLFAVLVPDEHAFATCQNDGQRMVIVCTILCFELHAVAHCVTITFIRS